MESFVYGGLPWHVLFGNGFARTRLVDEVERLGLKSVMLIAAETELELARSLTSALGDRVAFTFSEVKPHVPHQTATAARSAAADHNVDGLISVGGGSTTGTAKIVALTTGLPIVAIPTTFAGSEMTPVWGMTTDENKETGVDRRVLPQSIIYDPELTLTLPRGLAASSGFNAMAHCIEALWAPGTNPLTASMAIEGVEALAEGLRILSTSDDVAEAYGLLLFGACLAGGAFAVAGSGVHHKICHALGGAFNLPHAETHAIVLPRVLEFNAPGLGNDLERLKLSLRSEDPVAELMRLSGALGVPAGLRHVGLAESDLPRAIELVAAKLPIPNPRALDRDAVTSILHAAF